MFGLSKHAASQDSEHATKAPRYEQISLAGRPVCKKAEGHTTATHYVFLDRQYAIHFECSAPEKPGLSLATQVVETLKFYDP